jgi:hypothetical protein
MPEPIERGWRTAAAAALACWGVLLVLTGAFPLLRSAQGAEVTLKGVIRDGRWVQPPALKESEAEGPVLYRGLLRNLRLEDGSWLVARAAERWTTEWPFPVRFPGFRLLLRGEFLPPGPGSALAVRGGDYKLSIAGHESEGRPVAGAWLHDLPSGRGWVPFTLRWWTPTPGEDYPLGLDVRFVGPAGDETAVAGVRLRPPAEADSELSRPGRREARAGTLTGVVLILAALALAGGRRISRPLGFLRSETPAIVFALLLALGAWLRLSARLEQPAFGETKDELADIWNGWHLVRGLGPCSWGDMEFAASYRERRHLFWLGNPYVIVRPYLDRPPLFPLLTGLASGARSVPSFFFTSLERARLLPIALSLLSLVAVFFGGCEACRSVNPARDLERRDAVPSALLGTLLVTACPAAVLGSRLVKADALLALLFVSAVWIALRVERQGTAAGMWALSLLAATGPWTKEIGLLAGLLPAVWLFRSRTQGSRRRAVILLGVALASAGAYLAYGFAIGGDIFGKVLAAQAAKPGGFETLWNIAVSADVAHHHLPALSGWTLALWGLAVAAAVRGRGRHAAFALAAVLYLLAIGVLAKPEAFGWYRIPLYPLLGAAAGPSLLGLLRRPRAVPWLLIAAAILWLPLSDLLPAPGPWTLRAAVGLVAAPLLLHELLGTERSRRGAAAAGALILAAGVAVAAIPAVRVWLGY